MLMAWATALFPMLMGPAEELILRAPEASRSRVVALTAKVLLPPPIVTAPVEVPVLMLVTKLEEALRLTAAPVTVRPASPVRRPAEVMVPLPEVEMSPEVVMESPEVAGERVVVPLSRLQKPTVPEVSVVVMLPEQVKSPVA
jgi:hypothetical protein